MTIRSSLGLSCLMIALAAPAAMAQEPPATTDAAAADAPMLLAVPAAPEGETAPPAADAAPPPADSPAPVPAAPAPSAEINAAPLPTAEDVAAPAAPVATVEIPPEIDIKPHQAVYRLSIGDVRIKEKVAQASGTIELRISRDCYHWSLDRLLDFRIAYVNNRETHLITTERQRETLGGEKYWFWARTTLNGGTSSIKTGVAERPKPGQMVPLLESMDSIPAAPVAVANATENPEAKPAEGEAAPPPPAAEISAERPAGVMVVFSWPTQQEIEVPPDVIFPFNALRQQLLALHAGALLNEQHVFDGSRVEGADRALYTPVKAPSTTAGPVPDGDPEMLNTPFWRLTTSYVPMEIPDAKQVRAVTMKLHENGVASEMAIDYGPFVVNATLVWVKELPAPTCN